MARVEDATKVAATTARSPPSRTSSVAGLGPMCAVGGAAGAVVCAKRGTEIQREGVMFDAPRPSEQIDHAPALHAVVSPSGVEHVGPDAADHGRAPATGLRMHLRAGEEAPVRAARGGRDRRPRAPSAAIS